MLFRQFVDDDLGCASYLVGDEEAGQAVLIDPAFAVDQYLDAAERHEVELVGVLETHTHADHVSGHGRMALEHGLRVHVHEAAHAAFANEPLEDGTEIELGRVVLRTLHTPGHRPEHCAFAVIDRSRGDEPWLVLTGDSLFVGDAARPDLAVDALDGAEGLFHSLHRLVALGDGVEVYPGHVAGSLCGAAMSSKPSTTIGFERRFNHALTESYQDFMANAGGAQPPRPPNMEAIVELNRGPLFGAREWPEHTEARGNAVVLDVRDVDAYAAGHLPGSVNVPVRGSAFGTKTAFVLPERPIHLHARDQDEARLAAQRLWAVGIFGLDGWSEAGGSERMAYLSIDDVDRLLSADAIQLLDVRETDERDRVFIPGSKHLPYRMIRQAAANGLCSAKPIVTICESGPRAAIAASVLQSVGVDARPVLGGGVATWHGERCSFRRCGS